MKKRGKFGEKTFEKIKDYASLVRFEHTLFAMPFALAAMVVAAGGWPAWSVCGWIVVAMVGARTAAMAFNRIADRKIDAKNPRTKMRELPNGKVKLWEAWALMLVAIALFIFAAWKLNPLALALSPVALIIVLGYSLTKRFTRFSHLVLGLALAVAPVGAWVAVTGEISWPPIVLAAAVMLWTAGFDSIYALQDVEFDKKQKLFSMPQSVGVAPALFLSRVMHVATAVLLYLFGVMINLGWFYWTGVAVIAASLIYEQRLVTPKDLSKINAAFFTMNGLVSVVFFVATLADVLWRRSL